MSDLLYPEVEISRTSIKVRRGFSSTGQAYSIEGGYLFSGSRDLEFLLVPTAVSHAAGAHPFAIAADLTP